MAATIPANLLDLVTTNILGHLATVRPDGSLAPAIVWVDFDGKHVLMSSPVGARKGHNSRGNAQVALSVVDPKEQFRYLQIRGHIAMIRPDTGLEVIDRLSMRYTGRPYYDRAGEREVFEIAIDHVRTGKP